MVLSGEQFAPDGALSCEKNLVNLEKGSCGVIGSFRELLFDPYPLNQAKIK